MISVEAYKKREQQEFLRMAVICSTIVNYSLGKKSRRAKPSDFMPKFSKQQTPKEQLAILKRIAAKSK